MARNPLPDAIRVLLPDWRRPLDEAARQQAGVELHGEDCPLVYRSGGFWVAIGRPPGEDEQAQRVVVRDTPDAAMRDLHQHWLDELTWREGSMSGDRPRDVRFTELENYELPPAASPVAGADEQAEPPGPDEPPAMAGGAGDSDAGHVEVGVEAASPQAGGTGTMINTVIDARRETLLAQTMAMLKERIDACDETIRNTNEAELNNRLFSSAFTHDEREAAIAQLQKLYDARTRKAAVEARRASIVDAVRVVADDQLETFDVADYLRSVGL